MCPTVPASSVCEDQLQIVGVAQEGGLRKVGSRYTAVKFPGRNWGIALEAWNG